MALKLRRGTDAERQLITPEAGEPLWIDNEALWIGDGSTVGGIKVTGGIENDLATVSIDALSDVDTTSAAPTNGQTLVWNTDKFEPGTIAFSLNDITNVDTSSNTPNNGDSLVWNGASWVPGTPTFTGGGVITGFLDGDMQGSVFADDSTLLIDGVNGKFNLKDTVTGDIKTRAVDDFPRIVMVRDSATDISNSDLSYGSIQWRRDDPGGEATTAILAGGNEAIYYGQSRDGNITVDKYVVLDDGQMSIGGFVPTAKLDVRGDIKAESSITPGVYADATARDAAITSPAAGMMVFVTDVAKFQGYDGTSWVNLN